MPFTKNEIIQKMLEVVQGTRQAGAEYGITLLAQKLGLSKDLVYELHEKDPRYATMLYKGKENLGGIAGPTREIEDLFANSTPKLFYKHLKEGMSVCIVRLYGENPPEILYRWNGTWEREK